MLPVVTSDIREKLEALVSSSGEDWKKELVYHVKEDNPELNTLLLALAEGSSDPKRVILAGYLVYKSLELAEEAELI